MGFGGRSLPEGGLHLDANATLGVIPEVWQELADLGDFGLNPSSVHRGGQRARAILEEAREEVGALLGVGPGDRIVFTSGATEANCTVIQGAALQARRLQGATVEAAALVTTAFEHPSVLEAFGRWARDGVPTHIAGNPVAELPESVAAQVERGARFVSCMAANNETGTLLPLEVLVTSCRERSAEVVIHSDLVQLVGKVPVSFRTLGIEYASVSGHKIGALPGIGALVMSKRGAEEIVPLLVGGPQELKSRAGTENVIGAASFGIAARLALQDLTDRSRRVRAARDELERLLVSTLGNAVQLHDFGLDRLPNTISVRFPGLRADDLVVALDRIGVYVSSGAACSSGKPQSSHVLRAFGLSDGEARETLRISFPCAGTVPDPADAAERIARVVQRMKEGR